MKKDCQIYRLLEIRNIRYKELGYEFYCPVYGTLEDEKRIYCHGCKYIPPYYK